MNSRHELFPFLQGSDERGLPLTYPTMVQIVLRLERGSLHWYILGLFSLAAIELSFTRK